MNSSLIFRDHRDLEDLNAYLVRAKRLDKDGVLRLRCFGDVLAVYVSPIFSGNLLADGPTVLGLRTMQLAEQGEVDAIVSISSLLDRMPRAMAAAVPSLEVPDVRSRAAWTGITPPKTGWEPVGFLPEAQLTEWAKAGIAEVANTLPDSIGSAIASRVRLQVWGRSVSLEFNLPAGAAFAAAGLGFLTKDEQIEVFRSHGWVRLSSKFGHVLARESYRIS